MKTTHLFLLFSITLCVGILAGCDDEPVPEKENILPTGRIITRDTVIPRGEILKVEAEGSDEDGTINRVVFYANGKEVFTDKEAPYQWYWHSPSRDTVALEVKARIYDNTNDYSWTEPIHIGCKRDVVYQEPVTDYDGNVYPTVKIGDQIWMAKNYRCTHYADGREILLGQVDSSFYHADSTERFYYMYNDSIDYVAKYGLYYNWFTVIDGGVSKASDANPSGIQGICPNGWHVPSADEWIEMAKNTSKQVFQDGTYVLNWDTLSDKSSLGLDLQLGGNGRSGLEIRTLLATTSSEDIYYLAFQIKVVKNIIDTLISSRNITTSKYTIQNLRCLKD